MSWESVVTYLAVFTGSRFFLMLGMQSLAKKALQSSKINKVKVHPSQIKREGMWPMGLVMDALFIALFMYFGILNLVPGVFWLSLGVMVLAHMFLVEPIYYFYHRLLHTKWLYRHHHLYHHKSILTEPTTSMSFTLSERFSYTLLFSLPGFVAYFIGVLDYRALLAYFILFDVLNSVGHLNVPMETSGYKRSKVWKWLIYSPEFHEKHHSLFTTNYALFMPIYDKLFGTETVDELTSDPLEEVDRPLLRSNCSKNNSSD